MLLISRMEVWKGFNKAMDNIAEGILTEIVSPAYNPRYALAALYYIEI